MCEMSVGGRIPEKRPEQEEEEEKLSKDIKIPREPKQHNNGKTFLSDLVSNSSQAKNILSIVSLHPPAVRNNLWDDKARILNNQSHFPFSSLLFHSSCFNLRLASMVFRRKIRPFTAS